MKNLNFIDWLAILLLIVGGLNWALVGIFEYDLVASIFGELSAAARVVYVVVGLAAIYQLITVGKLAKK